MGCQSSRTKCKHVTFVEFEDIDSTVERLPENGDRAERERVDIGKSLLPAITQVTTTTESVYLEVECDLSDGHGKEVWSSHFVLDRICSFLPDPHILSMVRCSFSNHIKTTIMLAPLSLPQHPQNLWAEVWRHDALVHLLFSFLGPGSLRALLAASRDLWDLAMLDSLAWPQEQDSFVPVDSPAALSSSEACCSWLDIPQECHSIVHSMSSLIDLRCVTPGLPWLCLARMSTPNCVPVAACFTSLRHLTIGSLRRSHPSSVVCDRDVLFLTRTLGASLVSLQLLKLRGITHIALSAISEHCFALRSLVIFGCSRMRLSLCHQLPPEDEQSIFLLPSVCDRSIRMRGLCLLDLRYSLDLSDALLKQITHRYPRIQM
jgi:hypothetical protein